MSVSGPEALRSLEEALRDVRREEDEVARRLARSAELVAKVRETESELFRQLAAVRLDAETQKELAGRLTQAESRAREQLKTHAAEVTDSEHKLQAMDAQIDALTAERQTLQAELEQHRAALEAISQRIAAEASKDPAYAAARQRAEELAHVAEESLRKTEQAETDREIKGRPYREDSLFMYLWERSYGTGAYKAGNLTRWLDGLVARHIGYHKARPNYAMLNEIPLRLREHADRQVASAEAARAEAAALRDAAIDAAGGRTAREALGKAETRIAEIDAAILAKEDERDAIASRQRDLAQGKDPAYAEAIAAVGQALGREDIKTLLEQARATTTGEDDTIVKQIDDARQRLVEEATESIEQKQRLKTLSDRRRELEDIQFEFKKSRFDDPRSSFREDNLVGDLLSDFLRGGLSAANYWGHWQKSQNWTGGGSQPWGGIDDDGDDERRRSSNPWGDGGGFTWPDSSFGGSGGRRSGGALGGGWGKLPSGGGFSRPRSGSSGSRRHSGFKTGGGF